MVCRVIGTSWLRKLLDKMVGMTVDLWSVNGVV